MTKPQAESRNGKNNVLRVRSNTNLPDYKIAADLDDLDRALIEVQLEDPFFSYNDVAEKFGITSATIRNRIKRLKASGVIDVITLINPYKINYDVFSMIGVKIKAEASPKKFVETLQNMEGVSAVTMVAGSFDFFITYVCRNMEEYRRFVTDDLRNIPGIASFESFIGLDLYERKFIVGLIT